MAYTPLNISLPKPSDTIGVTLSNIKSNLVAIRDMLVTTGIVQGYNYSFTSGTADYPEIQLFTRGTDIIKVVNNYFFIPPDEYTNNWSAYYATTDGTNYFPIVDDLGNYVLYYAWDVDGILINTTWSPYILI